MEVDKSCTNYCGPLDRSVDTKRLDEDDGLARKLFEHVSDLFTVKFILLSYDVFSFLI